MMTNSNFLWLNNAAAAALAELPVLEMAEFRNTVLQTLQNPAVRISAFFALPEDNGTRRLIAVLADAEQHLFGITSAAVGTSYPALTPENPAFHWFEREIAESTGIRPEGHPWLKPIRFQKPENGNDLWRRAGEILPGVTNYFVPEGTEMHEVAVGPIHAGVIEPGHFRFQCMGETVYHLEIELGYQHRGVENLLAGLPDCRKLATVETIAGDSTIAHTLAFCKAIEALSGRQVEGRFLKLRAIALELERLANHIGDLGALAGDVAFLPASSFCGRIRGEYLNLTAELCGNRFGRHLIVPGGSAFTLEKERIDRMLKKLRQSYRELTAALDLMFDSPTVLDRLENTGAVPGEVLHRIGAVGTAARAGGLQIDARQDFPIAEFENNPPSSAYGVNSGDVFGRAKVRYEEIKASHQWLFKVLEQAETGDNPASAAQLPQLAASQIAVSVVEGWRGEVCHVVITDEQGALRKVKVVDPSFHNWFALALALRGGQISDFPICNKSFNLSYCGHDL